MNDLFTMKEAINLITEFKYYPLAVNDEEIKMHSDIFQITEDIKRFISEGYAEPNEYDENRYKINQKGEDLLHKYIEELSKQFIKFMHQNNSRVSKINARNWYNEKFELDDVDLSEEICDYIKINLYNYGYRCNDGFSNGEAFYIIEKI